MRKVEEYNIYVEEEENQTRAISSQWRKECYRREERIEERNARGQLQQQRFVIRKREKRKIASEEEKEEEKEEEERPERRKGEEERRCTHGREGKVKSGQSFICRRLVIVHVVELLTVKKRRPV